MFGDFKILLLVRIFNPLADGLNLLQYTCEAYMSIRACHWNMIIQAVHAKASFKNHVCRDESNK